MLRTYCASLPIKRDQKFAFANTRMVRYGGEIENGDFDKGKNANVRHFGMYLLLRYKAIGLLENFGERCQNS